MDKIQKYLPIYRNNFNTIDIPLTSSKACAIIEPRCHEYLELVIKNVIYYLPGWSLFIFHSKKNESFVREIVKGHNEKNIHFILISESNLCIKEYNKIMTSPQFYQHIKAEYVLIFQTDSYLCRFGMEDYVKLGYDYIGAPWDHEKWEYQAGNGGLSLRKISTMIHITSTIPWNNENEDVYFQQGLVKMKYPMLKKDSILMQAFSVETIWHENPLGTHKYWIIFPDEFIDVYL